MSVLMRAAAKAKQDPSGHFQSMPILWCLRESGPLRSNLLAETVFADPSTVSRQVAVLVEQGLVTRGPDPEDGRAALLTITDAGRELVADRLRKRDEYLRSMTAGWSDADRDQFAELFERFAADFASHVSAHPHVQGHAAHDSRTETS
jgi:DNA-binding MarR family transcriptional regulator